LRHCEQYSRHPTQIARNHRQFEMLIDLAQAAVHRLSNLADRLAPTEMLFDARPNGLADVIADVPRRATINGAAPPQRRSCRATCGVHLSRPAIRDEIARVIRFVGTDRLGMAAPRAIELPLRMDALAQAIRMTANASTTSRSSKRLWFAETADHLHRNTHPISRELLHHVRYY
jgi:hypothetical protein